MEKPAKEKNKPLIYRKERKFLVEGADIHAVEFIIKAHPAMFSQPFPPRYINNIYFDSNQFGNYGDNVVGAKNRHKFRIRWYGDQFGYIKKPILEIKIKKGLAGAKRHYPLVPFTLEPGFNQYMMRDVFNRSDLPGAVREMLRYQAPTLINRYFRKYFLSADRRFRVTLDTQLQFIRIDRHQNSFMQRRSA
ncbi:MAG TPA: VTC domain-containing protein, partial [Phaeodactylibacter sp.]|nr:VTC domain-containing protein [Phaeodactylibacter sp.]